MVDADARSTTPAEAASLAAASPCLAVLQRTRAGLTCWQGLAPPQQGLGRLVSRTHALDLFSRSSPTHDEGRHSCLELRIARRAVCPGLGDGRRSALRSGGRAAVLMRQGSQCNIAHDTRTARAATTNILDGAGSAGAHLSCQQGAHEHGPRAVVAAQQDVRSDAADIVRSLRTTTHGRCSLSWDALPATYRGCAGSQSPARKQATMHGSRKHTLALSWRTCPNPALGDAAGLPAAPPVARSSGSPGSRSSRPIAPWPRPRPGTPGLRGGAQGG
jgi:hypothetical protein